MATKSLPRVAAGAVKEWPVHWAHPLPAHLYQCRQAAIAIAVEQVAFAVEAEPQQH